MCCPVVQGYGLTETCASSFIAVPGVPVSVGLVCSVTFDARHARE